MKSVLNAKTLKMLGGGIIVAGAFAILFPGLLTYLFGLSKLLLLVVVTIGLASLMTFMLAKLRRARSPRATAAPSAAPADTTSDT